MPEMLKGWLSILIHFAIGLGCCLIYVFCFKKIDVLPQFLLSRKLAETGILFIRIMPSLLVSAILIGYAVIFGTCGQNTVPRFSNILLHYLKEAFIMLLPCIAIYIILIEIVMPSLADYRYYSELKTHDYYDFIKEADNALRDGDAEKAYDKATAALGIWKNNPDALQFLDKAKILHESYSADRKQNNSESASETAEPENLTAERALFISKRFMNKYDFYTAHYYAMQAYQLSTENAPYREEALRLAAQAWNQIEKGIADLTAEFDIRLYQAKKAGYEMIQQGDYVKAYYQFLNAERMLEQNDPLKRDPDIERFIEITRQKLLEEVFFIDETAALPLFETVRNIHFTVPASPLGTRAAEQITIESLSYITNNNIKEIYGRNCELTQYTADGKILYRLRIPFIKLIPIVSHDGIPMLRMLFRAVDKQRNKIVLKPVVLEGTIPLDQQASRVLPFSYSDFELIIAANEGEKSMTIPQLYAFRQRGAQYGFPAQIYQRELLARMSDVFLILIISIYMLVLAWRFRVPPHRQFRHTWTLAFPLFFVLVTGLVETGRYCARLVIALLTDISYSLSPLLLLFAYTLCFIGICILFIGQRSEA